MSAPRQHGASARRAEALALQKAAPVRTRSAAEIAGERAKALRLECSGVLKLALRDARLSSGRLARVTRKQPQHVRRWVSPHEPHAPSVIDVVRSPEEIGLPLIAWQLSHFGRDLPEPRVAAPSAAQLELPLEPKRGGA
jgi:hypothetical protein